MIYSVTFSKPGLQVEELFGRSYKKIKIRLDTASSLESKYFCEMFTDTQVFHKKMSEAEVTGFIENHAGKTYKNCVVRTDLKEITYLANKKGKVTKLEKNISREESAGGMSPVQRVLSAGKQKNYLIPEGTPVPFLVLTGVMTPEGKVIASKYDKFRQINRFLEFINDILPEITRGKAAGEPVRVADFGCGKSYLTFAVHYYLKNVKKLPCEIEGLDLKKEVIDYCNKITADLNLEGISFSTGDISSYSGVNSPDIVVTLHACDTATDFALKYAVSRGAKAILSVPCCQHQVNKQIQEAMKVSEENKNPGLSQFDGLVKWGIIREKFSSLLTDALRGQYLETEGYSVQMLEFIDIEHTPKNILIRAVKKNGQDDEKIQKTKSDIQNLVSTFGITPEIFR